MIKFKNQVPAVYTKASRDFQYLSWLIDIVLNSVKHNVDSLYDLPNAKADPRLTELLAMTLGFKVKRNYNQKQLAALVAALPKILKYKGTETAIHYAGNALIAASGATGDFRSKIEDGELQVTLPDELVDIALFSDLLPYILPAGMSCRIKHTSSIARSITTKVQYQDIITSSIVRDIDEIDQIQKVSGLSTMFDPALSTVDAVMSNFAGINKNNLNTGLLDNTIIAAVVEPVQDYFGTTTNNASPNTGDVNPDEEIKD